MKQKEPNKYPSNIKHLQFIDIYKLYYENLFAYGVSLGFSSENVKDAIQEVFLNLYNNESLDIDIDTIKIKFYLLRSVKNKLIDMERKYKLHTEHLEKYDNEFKLMVSVEDLIIDEENKDLLKKRIETILNKLSKQQREIIYLRFIEEMPYEEIALLLDMKVQTIRGQVFKAMDKLRKLNREDYFFFCYSFLLWQTQTNLS